MSDTQEQFETKLAAAGEALTKLANDRGLSLNDFTEEETIDLLSTIMGEGGSSDGGAPAADAKTASATPAPAAPAPAAQAPATKVAYVEALGEVMKVAAANGYDLNTANPAEVHAAVEQMQTIMADPSYATKQAALQEKVAEADALGRVMAHAYVDELSKIAAKTASAPAEDDEKTKAEKKAALVRELRSKTAGAMPPQFAAHMKGKDGDKGKDDKDEDEKAKKEEAEKKAAFEKQAAFRAAEVLIENNINPANGEKFASEAEKVEAGANLILAQKGYIR